VLGVCGDKARLLLFLFLNERKIPFLMDFHKERQNFAFCSSLFSIFRLLSSFFTFFHFVLLHCSTMILMLIDLDDTPLKGFLVLFEEKDWSLPPPDERTVSDNEKEQQLPHH
jgi:hypothetical protein